MLHHHAEANIIQQATIAQYDIDAAIWLQRDAAHLYRFAAVITSRDYDDWLAVKVQQNAAHSAALARKYLGMHQ